MEIRGIRTPGLGDTTYVLAHEGLAIVVDPQRDVDRFLAAADALGARVQLVLETHVHNDYVSGGRPLAAETGARLVLPAGAGVAFDHVPAFHQEDLPADGGLAVRPIHTPGHTPEHLSYLVLIDGQPAALFSGGSLLVGSAGRTDLLGAERAHQLGALQYQSLQRLQRLPGELGLFPTHGEGSFCTVSGAGRSTSTIQQERDENPALAYPDVNAFVEGQLADLQPYPTYYARMAPINVRGPEPLAARTAPSCSPDQVEALGNTLTVVDARPRAAFAEGHLPGALGVELGDQFATWVGWLLPFNAELALVLDEDQDVDEAVVQLGRIGFDRVRCVIGGGAALKAAGKPLQSFRTTDLAGFTAAIRSGDATQILDVRAPSEWDGGRIKGSHHRYVPDLAEGPPPNLSREAPVWVACGTGYRATIAAGLLERSGFQPIVLAEGGVPDVLEHLLPTRRGSVA